jgi:hypothetical protein
LSAHLDGLPATTPVETAPSARPAGSARHWRTDMMQLNLDKISRTVAAGAHAVLLLDRAGWHTTAKLEARPTSPRSSCLPARPN